MVRQYETVFILTPVLSESQMKEAVDKFKNLLQTNGAEIVEEQSWGLRKLAYPVQGKSTGFYQLIEFKAEGDVVDKLEVAYRRDERVIRFQTLKMNKYAVRYAEKKRRQKREKKDDGSASQNSANQQSQQNQDSGKQSEQSDQANQQSPEAQANTENQETKGNNNE